ncbi:amino acid adenylation domain-containing protein, partial [Streptomyces sp. NPDC047315]|uniref:non-ribosomal peptide synthetase n=1 Tax=Streptomyces sp. NPDC047315 TaxID=3155142 RepID=UPI0033E0E92A
MVCPDAVSVSSAQREIWLAQQRNPKSPAYRVGEYLEIGGWVDEVHFESALRQAVAEADALHRRFVEENGELRQYARTNGEWPLPVLDVSDAPDPVAAAEEWMRADLARPMDLARDHLFSYALFKIASDRYIWCQTYHHIVMDAFSWALFARRVAELYSAVVSGTEPGPSGFGSSDLLVRSDTAYRASADFQVDRGYWARRFGDRPAPARLAAEPTGTPARPVRRSAALPPAYADRLRAVADQVGVRYSSLMISAVALFLHRMTGAEDVVLTLPVTARTDPGLRTAPGTFSNLVPLRIEVRPEMTVRDLLTTTAAEIRDAARHQRYRGEDVVRDLDPVGKRHGLLGPYVNFLSFPYDFDFAGGKVTGSNLATGFVDDLAILLSDRSDGSGTTVSFDAHPGLYGEDALARHLATFLRLLDFLVDGAAPDARVGRLDLVSDDERRRLLDWGRPSVPAQASEATLVESFQGRVARHPDAVAVVVGDAALTYRELNERANGLAHWLGRQGVGPETRVGLALPRSFDLVIAIVAVVKAGGAYVPIDPAYPRDRIGFVIEDADPLLVLVTDETADCVPPAGRARVVVLDSAAVTTATARQPTTDPAASLSASNSAYVIYTSGSTGVPKGVLVSHRSVVGLLNSTRPLFRFGSDDVWTMFHSTAFDFSVWELWGALSSGGRVVVVPFETSRAPEKFLQLLVDEEVTVLNQTPSAFYQLIEADREAPGSRLSLRTVIFGGEALDPTRLKEWYGRHSPDEPALINMYGITETTVHVTHLGLEPETAGTATSPIGGPLAGLRVFVLDGGLGLVPVGVVGELYVGGLGLARGYVGR